MNMLDWIEFGTSISKDIFLRNKIIKPTEVNKYRFKHDNIDVYSTMLSYDDKNQNTANLLGDFYLDLDTELNTDEDFEIIKNDVNRIYSYLDVIMGIREECIQAFFSGNKGVHIIVPHEILGIKPNKDLNNYYKMMAQDINKFTSGETIDLRIYDNKRLFRLPNSIHSKSGLYKIFLKKEEIVNMRFTDIQKKAENSRMVPDRLVKRSSKAERAFRGFIKDFDNLKEESYKIPNGSDVTLEYTPPCVEHLLNNKVHKGKRNDTVAFLASYYKQSGLSMEEGFRALMEWNDKMCRPRMPKREIDITNKSIYKGHTKMGCTKAQSISECDKGKCKLK